MTQKITNIRFLILKDSRHLPCGVEFDGAEGLLVLVEHVVHALEFEPQFGDVVELKVRFR